MIVQQDRHGRATFGKAEFGIQVLIILNLIAFALATLPDLTPRQVRMLDIFEMVSLGIYMVEYVLRVIFSESRKAYICSFMGIVDLLATAPALLIGLDLRSVRAFRLLRLFRMLKLARCNSAIRRYHEAYVTIREELMVFGFTAMIMLYLAAVGIYHFENRAQPEVFSSVFQSLWWAVTTLTTVGYGDTYPITVGGKLFTFLVLIVGLGIVAVPTSLFASALSHTRRRDTK